MTITTICKRVLTDRSALQVRLHSTPKGEAKQYDCKPAWLGRQRGWVILDTTTAAAIMAVHDALKPELRAKLDTLPLGQLVGFCWRVAA